MRLLCEPKGNTDGEKAVLKRNSRYKKREQVRKKIKRERASLLSRSCLPRQESGKGRACVLCVCMCYVG